MNQILNIRGKDSNNSHYKCVKNTSRGKDGRNGDDKKIGYFNRNIKLIKWTLNNTKLYQKLELIR